MRGGGAGSASAWRIVRRCTWYRPASARIEVPSRASWRIAANRPGLSAARVMWREGCGGGLPGAES